MRAGGVEYDGSGVARLRERPVVAGDDNLVLEVRDAVVIADDSVEAGVDNRAKGEAGASAMFDDGLAKERRHGRLAGGPIVMMSGIAESTSFNAAIAASIRLTALPKRKGSKSVGFALGVDVLDLAPSEGLGWKIWSPWSAAAFDDKDMIVAEDTAPAGVSTKQPRVPVWAIECLSLAGSAWPIETPQGVGERRVCRRSTKWRKPVVRTSSVRIPSISGRVSSSVARSSMT